MLISRRTLFPLCLLLAAFVTPRFGTAAPTATLSGRVIEEGTEKPLQGIQVGAVRWFKLGEYTWKQRVEPERTAITDASGEFTFRIPPNAPGLRKIAVFTCTEERGNLTFKDAPFEGRLPQAKDFDQPGVVAIDLTKDATEIVFALPETPNFQRNVMVPMRDGARLATHIFLPRGEGPWPAILSRTPYGKPDKIPTGQLQNGFAVVRQDFRGRFASEGDDDMPFINDGWGELQDGYDTIEWIAQQPWCNGKIGTVGGSAGGITQVMTAGAVPPHLTCQLIAVAFGSMYHHAAYPGGAFRKALVEGWLQNNKFSPHCLEKVLAHPTYDELWRQVDASTRSKHIQTPGLFSGGWYDVFCQGTIDAFMWRQYEGGDGARGKQKLIMGAWVHGRKEKLGEFDLPKQALRSPLETRSGGWFERWLKGEDNGIMDEAAVHYYVMGAFDEPGAPGHEWRSSDVWPVPSRPTSFYLHADGTLSQAKPGKDGESRSFRYDPTNPVPTRGGCNLILDKGPYDQRPVENRPDVLLYTSEPLEEPLEVTGRIKADLWASSLCKDTDFTVKLTDVYPDGRSVLIQDGIIRARFRNSFEREELMTPGEIHRFEIDLWSTSIIFNRGHRIRVAVSSSNAPRFEPNPNTGDPFRANNNTIVVTNTIYHDAEHASRILLPVVHR